MSALFIDDGYTVTKIIPAKRGLHPDAEVSYRPALARKRHEYHQRLNAGDPAKIAAFEDEVIESHVVSIGGEKVTGRAGRIVPSLRKDVIDLVLGYEGADEATDQKN